MVLKRGGGPATFRRGKVSIALAWKGGSSGNSLLEVEGSKEFLQRTGKGSSSKLCEKVERP